MYPATRTPLTFVFEHGIQNAEAEQTFRVIMLYDEGTHQRTQETAVDYWDTMVITTRRRLQEGRKELFDW